MAFWNPPPPPPPPESSLAIIRTAIFEADAATLVFAIALVALMWSMMSKRKRNVTAAAVPLGLTSPSCVACGKGGYEQLIGVPLDGAAATSGASASFQGITKDECVTVRVAASGINYADVCIRWGLYTSWNLFGGGRRPGQETRGDVPGFEFAGTVELVGRAVKNVKVGDQVFGVSLFGAYTSRILVPAHQVFRRPASLSASEGAALPCVAMTAWFAVRMQASPLATLGNWVLVHSAAGGVGSMLIQMCKIQGWRVVGVVGSAHKVAECKRLGADVVIDKSASDLWRIAEEVAPNGFAVIFDANGVATLADSYAHLEPCGKLVVYGFHTMLPREGGVLGAAQWLRLARDYLKTPRFNPLSMVPANKSVLAFNLSFLFDQKQRLADAMEEILGWMQTGALSTPAVTEFAMDHVREAHAALEGGRTIGKLVLLPP
jgi:NADPH:quinone reductase-like Zn-dependent oxidoreductase